MTTDQDYTPEDTETADLFSFAADTETKETEELTPEIPQDTVLSEPEPETETEEPAPETLPLLKPAIKKLPLIFSERAPVPTRGGEPEVKDKRKNSSSSAKRHKNFVPLSATEIPAGATPGQVLVMARERGGYTFDDVKELTRISHNYLAALEQDDISHYPQPVYAATYIRSLSELYLLQEDVKNILHQLYTELHPSANPVPQEVLQKVNSEKQINEEEERRITRIVTAAFISIGIAIILGIWALTSAVVRHVQEQEAETPAAIIQTEAVKPAAPPVPFDQKKFEIFNADRVLDLDTLKPGKTPQIRRRN